MCNEFGEDKLRRMGKAKSTPCTPPTPKTRIDPTCTCIYMYMLYVFMCNNNVVEYVCVCM